MKIAVLRDKRSLWVIFLIFFPVLITVGYGALVLPLASAWPYLFLSMAVAAFGAAFASFFLAGLPSADSFPHFFSSFSKTETGWESAFAEQEQKMRALEEVLEEKQGQIASWESRYEKEREEKEGLIVQIAEVRGQCERELQQKEETVREMQYRLDEWQAEIDKKQRHTAQLESKIRDLSYEIKTLLQLADLDAEEEEELGELKERVSDYMQEEHVSQKTDAVLTDARDASKLLRRSIDLAQKMTGSQYFEYRSSPVVAHPYTLDLRHLFDQLRGEVGGLIVVYSQKEERLLFVNDFVREWLGWQADKFVQNFPSLVQEGWPEWQNALGKLAYYKETDAKLVLRSKNGDDLPVHCLLGMIPSGLFRGYVVGACYAV